MALAGGFSEQLFETQLVGLKDTQESISALSGWCMKHKDHHKKIVACWLYTLKRVKIDQRLNLFYLANDVIQYSRRKNLDFVDSWSTALQKATPLVRDDKVKDRVLRIFDIWEKRQIYDETFIADLRGLLTTSIKKKTEETTDNSESSEFQPASLVRKIRAVKGLEANVASKLKRLKDCRATLQELEKKPTAKELDKHHGSIMINNVEEAYKNLESYIKTLEQEVREREKLSELLTQATLYYETERGEAKIIFNAYKSFANRVKALEKKLEELIPTLPTDSPLPSPDINAPSPSPSPPEHAKVVNSSSKNDSDLDLSFVNSSFIGNSQFMDNIQSVFTTQNGPTEYRPSMTQTNYQQPPPKEPSPSVDINGSFNVAAFLKYLSSGSAQETGQQQGAEAQSQAYQPMQWPGGEQWLTPQSPPVIDGGGVGGNMRMGIVYDDGVSPMPTMPDVDHRLLSMPPPPLMDDRGLANHHLPPKDVDHRNLISLTGGKNGQQGGGWSSHDIDQRGYHKVDSNVDQVDMEVSDSEEELHRRGGGFLEWGGFRGGRGRRGGWRGRGGGFRSGGFTPRGRGRY